MHEWHIPFRNRHAETQHIALCKPDNGLVQPFRGSRGNERAGVRIPHGHDAVIGSRDGCVLLHAGDPKVLSSRNAQLSLRRGYGRFGRIYL